MALVCSPMCRGYMSLNPNRTSDEKICKLNSPSLAMNDKIVLEDLCITTAAEVVENLSEDNEKGVISNDIWSEWRLTVISATGRIEMGIVLGMYCSLEAADHSQKSAPKGTCRPT